MAGAVAVAIMLLASVLVTWARRRFLVVIVDGHSMAPTLRVGERLLARRRRPTAQIATGDIVVFAVGREMPGTPVYFVKRIAAIAHVAVHLRRSRGWPVITTPSNTSITEFVGR